MLNIRSEIWRGFLNGLGSKNIRKVWRNVVSVLNKTSVELFVCTLRNLKPGCNAI